MPAVADGRAGAAYPDMAVDPSGDDSSSRDLTFRVGTIAPPVDPCFLWLDWGRSLLDSDGSIGYSAPEALVLAIPLLAWVARHG